MIFKKYYLHHCKRKTEFFLNCLSLSNQAQVVMDTGINNGEFISSIGEKKNAGMLGVGIQNEKQDCLGEEIRCC